MSIRSFFYILCLIFCFKEQNIQRELPRAYKKEFRSPVNSEEDVGLQVPTPLRILKFKNS